MDDIKNSNELIKIMKNNKLDLNTHKNDGPLGILYHKLILDDLITILPSFEESIEQIEIWLSESLIANKINIYRTIELFKIDKKNNYDDLNQINVEELLPRVINIVKNYDSTGRDLFLIVLGEIMELGSCSQGRTTRLLNFYIPTRT